MLREIMKQKIICHITTAHSPLDDRIFHKECRTLGKNGFKVFLIAQNNKNEIVENVHIISITKTNNRIIRMIVIPIKVLLYSIKLNADLYHFHDPEFIIAGIILKVIGRAKIIYDVHEDYGKQILTKYYISKNIRKIIALLIDTIEYISSHTFDGIITATDEILKKFKFHQKAISVKNFPLLEYMPIIKNNIYKTKDEFSLVYIGGISEQRGIIQIIKALELIEKKIKLYIYGKFETPDLEAILRKMNGYEKVRYMGYVDHKEIPNILKKADMGIVCLLPYPNYINSLPNKLGEYMMAGIPVIASNFPLWKEIIEGNNCGICVDPTNPKEIAKNIEYLIEHPEELRQMGANGRKAVEEKYNWDIESKKMLKLYNTLIKK
jgi:glycosyltransferase involved in cell wall biosynthesis